MNVKLNKCIQEMPAVQQVSFLPSCGDESNPLGAAYARAVDLKIPIKPLANLYLGIGYSREDLGRFITAGQLGERYVCE